MKTKMKLHLIIYITIVGFLTAPAKTRFLTIPDNKIRKSS